MTYIPKRVSISNKICIVDSNFYNVNKPLINKEPTIVTFSSKISSPPSNTLAIVVNEFFGPFTMSKIRQANNSSFYSWLTIKNAISSDLNPILKVNIKHWSLNEIFMEGLIQKNGNIPDGVKFVAVTYGQYSTMILKDGAIYRKILNS